MRIWTLDFETYWSDTYSLLKMTTDAYVHHPEFKVQMLGVRDPDGNRFVLTGEAIREFLLTRVNWERDAILCHNAQFDGYIISQHYGMPQPRLWICTLQMARPILGATAGGSLAKVAEHFNLSGRKGKELIDTKGVRDWSPELVEQISVYCLNDVQLCWEAFLAMRGRFNSSELLLQDITIRCFVRPLLVLDAKLCREHLLGERERKKILLERAGINVKDEAALEQGMAKLQSPDRLAAALRELGVEPPTKLNAKGERKYAFAKTDAEFLALREHEDEAVRDIVEARLGTKSTIEESRAARFLEVAERACTGGRWPVMYNYCAAHTWRWGGGNKQNPQNLPRGGTLRQAVQAPKGYVLGVADSSQIECRMLNVVAGETRVVNIFANKGDIYCATASDIYNRKITKKENPHERHVGKTAELGLGYGMGYKTFAGGILTGKVGGAKVKFDAATFKAVGGDINWVKANIADIQQIVSVLPLPELALHAGTAKRIVDVYRETHPAVCKLWKLGEGVIEVMAGGGNYAHELFEVREGTLYAPTGQWLKYDRLHRNDAGEWVYFNKKDKGWVKLYGAKWVENLIQFLSRIVVGEQAVAIARRYPIVMLTHDEVVSLIPEREAEEGLAWMVEQMHVRPAWAPSLPVAAEGGFARDYRSAKS